ncbi:hypothetical protein GCM10022295_92710 [Streptomyces osmaniensis]|uniref:Uncharacterized protein n=1 Tax=Streptomyces osmaniensis TaxID=593134 RepID=A0ABP6Z409_9ACTN
MGTVPGGPLAERTLDPNLAPTFTPRKNAGSEIPNEAVNYPNAPPHRLKIKLGPLTEGVEGKG